MRVILGLTPEVHSHNLNSKMARQQSKYWVFTLNNYTEEELKDISSWTKTGVKGVAYGKEQGENGTPHLQGFIVMEKRCELGTVKKLNKRMHLERMKGNIRQNEDYCSKQDNLTVIGKCTS